MALGAQFAVDDPIVCLTSHGGVSMNMQELETAAREDLLVTIVVFNDYGMGNVRSNQKYVYDERYNGVNYRSQNFKTAVEAFDIPSRRVSRPNEIRPALETALDHDGPFVPDIETDIHPHSNRRSFRISNSVTRSDEFD